MSQPNKLELSNLNYEGSLEEYLKDFLGLSKSFLKKSGLSKKQLNLSIKPKDQLYIPINVINHGKINPNYVGSPIKVIDEDEEFIVLSKPAKIHIHPHNYLDQDTLLNAFYALNLSSYLNVNRNEYDRGLVYRLDYETSGLCLYAKSDEVYAKYRNQFHDLVESKEYFVICKGKCEDALYKDKVNYRGEKKGAGYVVGHGEYSAFIEVKFIEYNAKENLSLVKVKLYEGIRHQIRIQMAHHGHPILGDELYKGPKAQRLYLHCHEYKINNKIFRDENLVLFRELFDFDG